MIQHENDLCSASLRYSIDNYSFPSSSILDPSKRLLQRKKSNVVSRGIDFIKNIKWKSKANEDVDMRLPDIQEQQYKKALHTPSRYLPQHQSILTTRADGTILLFNDIASLCFQIDKSFIGKSLLDSLLQEPFKSQISSMLNRRHSNNFSQNNVLVCGTIVKASHSKMFRANNIFS